MLIDCNKVQFLWRIAVNFDKFTSCVQYFVFSPYVSCGGCDFEGMDPFHRNEQMCSHRTFQSITLSSLKRPWDH